MSPALSMGLHKIRRSFQRKIMFDEATVTNRLLEVLQSRDSEELRHLLQGWPKTPWTIPARRRCVERVWMAAAQTSDRDCLETLLDAGINCVDLRDDLGWTALMYAESHGKFQTVLTLLEAGADPNVSDHHGLCSPLHVAVRDRRPADVRALLAHGADPLFNPVGSTPESPLSTAASTGDERILRELVACLDDDVTAEYNKKKMEFALKSAVEAESDPCVQIMLNNVQAHFPEAVKGQCLVYSVYSGTLDVMESLLQSGAQMEQLYMEEPGPVFTAVWGNHMTTAQTLDCLRLLLKHGGSVDERSPDLMTPLMVVVGKGNFPVARFLLQQGSRVNYRDPDGQTALHHAARSSQVDVIRLLLEWGVDPDIADSFQRTALHKMIRIKPSQQQSEVIRCVCLLIQAGCDLEALGQPFEIAGMGSCLMSPLTLAIWEGKDEIAQLLMRIGCAVTPSQVLVEDLEQRLMDMDPKTKKMYIHHQTFPIPLKLACRNAIKRCMPFSRMRQVDVLPLPAQLRDYLRYADLPTP